MTTITPEKFLESKGIDLKKTSLFTVIEDHARQPDLCLLLEEYATAKISEIVLEDTL